MDCGSSLRCRNSSLQLFDIQTPLFELVFYWSHFSSIRETFICAMLKSAAICFFIVIFSIKNSVSDFRRHSNWPKRFEKTCGESYTDRIIGGQTAALGQFPWMARLVYRNPRELAEDHFNSFSCVNR